MGQNNDFPYPVLREVSDDFVDSIFQLEESKTSCFYYKNQVIFSFSLLLKNSSFLEYLENSSIKLVIRVECSRTAYREIFDIEKLDGEIKIPEKFVDSSVSISIFIIAAEDFVYSPEDLIEDFVNFALPVSMGTILGQITSKTYEIEKNNFVPTNSIFKISFVDEDGDAPMVDYGDSDYIKINFPMSMKRLYGDSETQEMSHTVLVNMILMEILTQLESDTEFLEGTNWGKRLRENIEVLLSEGDSLSEISNKFELIGKLLPNHNIVSILENF